MVKLGPLVFEFEFVPPTSVFPSISKCVPMADYLLAPAISIFCLAASFSRRIRIEAINYEAKAAPPQIFSLPFFVASLRLCEIDACIAASAGKCELGHEPLLI